MIGRRRRDELLQPRAAQAGDRQRLGRRGRQLQRQPPRAGLVDVVDQLVMGRETFWGHAKTRERPRGEPRLRSLDDQRSGIIRPL